MKIQLAYPRQHYGQRRLSQAAVDAVCRLPELLEELALAQEAGELKKAIKSYQKYDLLILDEWLIRCLTPGVLQPAGGH